MRLPVVDPLTVLTRLTSAPFPPAAPLTPAPPVPPTAFTVAVTCPEEELAETVPMKADPPAPPKNPLPRPMPP